MLEPYRGAFSADHRAPEAASPFNGACADRCAPMQDVSPTVRPAQARSGAHGSHCRAAAAQTGAHLGGPCCCPPRHLWKVWDT